MDARDDVADRTNLIDGVAPGVHDVDHGRPRSGASVPRRPRRGPGGLEVVAALLLVLLIARPALTSLLGGPLVQTWTTRMIAVVVQALPFLVLGVAVSGAVAALVPTGWLTAAVPRHPAAAVPIASLSGGLLPGCECSSVPIAGRLAERGMPAPAALAFMLAAPAINPVVLVATAVAFPGEPRIVVARFVASLAVAIVVGLVWARVAPRRGWDALLTRAIARLRPADDVAHGGRWRQFSAVARHDLVHAGGWLVAGAAVAASFQTLLPADVLLSLTGTEVLAIGALALLAIVLAVCSEADAFVAAGLPLFPDTALLTFLVVGPAVDVKLIALQAGVFGRGFALRFAPLTFGVAVVGATIVGTVLL